MRVEDEPPYVPLLLPDGFAEESEALRAGLEEEGIPFRLFPLKDQDGFVPAAHEAAGRSLLRVAVAGSSDGGCVHMARLPADRPMLSLPPGADVAQWRLLGHDAARLVKGLPLHLAGSLSSSPSEGSQTSTSTSSQSQEAP